MIKDGKIYDRFFLNGKQYDRFFLDGKQYSNLDSGLILDLPFQNNFTDYSANPISIVAGNVNGLPSFVSDGSGGYAVNFDGTKSLKTTVNFPINTSDKTTIEFDFKTSQSTTGALVELSESWHIPGFNAFATLMISSKLYVGEQITDITQRNSSTTTSNINDNTWRKIKIVIDRNLDASNTIKIYINGSLASVTTTTPYNTSGNFGSYKLYIGQRAGSSLGFEGQMKNLKIYNYSA